MKMKTIIKLLFVFSLPFIFCRCAADGIHYEREINVPEGIYLTGSASQFSVEAINGKMNVIKEGTLVALNTWRRFQCHGRGSVSANCESFIETG